MSTTQVSATAQTLATMDPDLRKVIANGSHSTEWDTFVGQTKAVRMLKLAAAGAKNRDAIMGNVLLSSPYAGIGKTSLGILVALEMGRGFRIVSGKVSVTEMRIILSEMADGDVLIMDEIHQLTQGGRANSEFLLPYLQNGTIIGPNGPEEFPRVTVIGTTTDAGRLPAPVLDRFEYKPPLALYNDVEAARIAMVLASKVFPKDLPWPDDETCLMLARAASNRPRSIRSLLYSLRDLACAGEVTGPQYDLGPMYELCEVTPDGLTTQAQKYLTVLLAQRGPLGEKQLGERVGEVGTGLAELERMLVDKGLIGHTQRGRELTRVGILRARELTQVAA